MEDFPASRLSNWQCQLPWLLLLIADRFWFCRLHSQLAIVISKRSTEINFFVGPLPPSPPLPKCWELSTTNFSINRNFRRPFPTMKVLGTNPLSALKHDFDHGASYMIFASSLITLLDALPSKGIRSNKRNWLEADYGYGWLILSKNVHYPLFHLNTSHFDRLKSKVSPIKKMGRGQKMVFFLHLK